MKSNTQLRLNSVVQHGVGSSSESLALDMIYEFLLHEFGQDLYDYISINQIGDDLDEFIQKESGNKIHINLRYPIYEDFESKRVEEKNKIRLNVIHTALLRISEFDRQLEPSHLEAIKIKILANDFSFEFVCNEYNNSKNGRLSGKLIVRPLIDKFEYYIAIENEGQLKCRSLIYDSRPGTDFNEFFKYGKWRGENELIISGTRKEVELHVVVSECKTLFVNLTAYANPPYFTVMRTDVSEEERKKAYKDWLHSLPPAVAAIVRKANN